MRSEDIDAAGKISNRPCHSQDAMHRARRELQQIDSVLQHFLILSGEPVHGILFRLIEMRVAATDATLLYFARTDHIAVFTGRRIGRSSAGGMDGHVTPSVETMDRFQLCD